MLLKVGDLVQYYFKEIGYTTQEAITDYGLVMLREETTLPFKDMVYVFWSGGEFSYVHESSLIILNGEKNE